MRPGDKQHVAHGSLVELRFVTLYGRGDRVTSIELPAEGLDLEGYLESIRRQLMREALDRSRGVQTQAAELLGISFRSFRY